MSSTVTVKNNPATTVAAVRTETTFDKVFADIPAGLGRVLGFLGENGTQPTGAPFTWYYQAPDGDAVGDIALCVPVASATDNDAGILHIEMEAETAASIVHKGSYETLGESYAVVAGWIQERGHSIVGPAREVYFNTPGEVADGDLLTEIVFPIDTDGSR